MQVNQEQILKRILTAFILVQVGVTIFALCPEKFALTKLIRDTTIGPWKYLGLYQGWELFAPEIRNINSHSYAEIHFDDGTVAAWPLPRPELMSPGEKVRKDKFRKWNGDNVQWEHYKNYWPAFARYVARLHYNGTGPKPVSFALLRFHSMVPPAQAHVNRAMIPHDQVNCPFFYAYKEEDLKQ